jgi:hypothetical protein
VDFLAGLKAPDAPRRALADNEEPIIMPSEGDIVDIPESLSAAPRGCGAGSNSGSIRTNGRSINLEKQLDRNLQDKQDDAIDRRCEFIRAHSPE